MAFTVSDLDLTELTRDLIWTFAEWQMYAARVECTPLGAVDLNYNRSRRAEESGRHDAYLKTLSMIVGRPAEEVNEQVRKLATGLVMYDDLTTLAYTLYEALGIELEDE